MATNDPNRQDASVTTAEPAIAVARDQIIDRVADHPWDELDDPCPLPARNLARNAQHGFGFYIGLAARQEGKGIRVIRIDAEPLSERTSLGQLDRNEVKIAAAITFTDKAAAARAQDVRIRPCGELMPPGLFGSTPRDGRRNRGDRRLRACLEKWLPTSLMPEHWAATSVPFDHLANACSPAPTWWIE
jgi:hypothetical protein